MEDIAIGIQNVSIRFNMSRDRVDSIKEYAIRDSFSLTSSGP